MSLPAKYVIFPGNSYLEIGQKFMVRAWDVYSSIHLDHRTLGPHYKQMNIPWE
jgi:hypothetical protein